MQASDQALRDALAIAIVQQKRRKDVQIREMAAKIARMEADLLKERGTSEELRAGVRRLVAVGQQQQQVDMAPASEPPVPARRQSQRQMQRRSRGLISNEACTNAAIISIADTNQTDPPSTSPDALRGWLPPLAPAADSSPKLDGSLLPGSSMDAAQLPGLASKAATLSNMLLVNIRLLRALRGNGPTGMGACRGDSRAAAKSGAAGMHAATCMPDHPASAAACEASELAEFVVGTLLHTPVTSLSGAYHTASAARLSVLLADEGMPTAKGDSSSGADVSGGSAQLLVMKGGDAARGAANSGSGSALAVVSQLVAQLFEAAAPSMPNIKTACATRGSCGSNADNRVGTEATQARAALTALAALPSTGAVLLCGCLLHLQRTCTALVSIQEELSRWAYGNSGLDCFPDLGITGGGGGGSRIGAPGTATGAAAAAAAAAEGAALTAMAQSAALFESSHELLDLWGDLCSRCLPTWAPELSAALPLLLPPLLAKAAVACTAVHGQLPALAGAFPLLTSAVCDAVGVFAAALQHIASAPGVCIGAGGPALRGAAVRACVQLRDAFMPSADGAAAPGIPK